MAKAQRKTTIQLLVSHSEMFYPNMFYISLFNQETNTCLSPPLLWHNQCSVGWKICQVSLVGIKMNPIRKIVWHNLLQVFYGNINVIIMSIVSIGSVLKKWPCNAKIALHVTKQNPSSRDCWIKKRSNHGVMWEGCPYM